MISIKQWLMQSSLPRNESRILLQHITHKTPAQLLTQDDETLPEQQLMALNQLAQRRIMGEPIAYLIGEREFYGRRFFVSPAVLIPRPETEHLIECALSKLPKNGTVLDLGTGSGIIAITLKCERPDLTVFASDISEAALVVATQNAKQHQAAIQFAQGSWYEVMPTFRLPEKLDLIIANPPYIEQNDPHLQQGDLRFEPQNALTDFADGLSAYRTLIAGATNYLINGGWLMMEHGYNQADEIRKLFQAAQCWQHIETQQDLAQLDRITLAQFRQPEH